jgi:signal transduction histidine kinase
MDAVQNGINQVRYMAQQKNITIRCEYKDCTNGKDNNDLSQSLESSISGSMIPDNDKINILKQVYGDPRRLIQILQNFLSNALKFTYKNKSIFVRIILL